MKTIMKKLMFRGGVLLFTCSMAASTSAADLKVGFITSLSGPNASLGVPYLAGIKASSALKSKVGGRDVKLIVLDDGSDPSTAARNARKLVDEEKVDLLISGSGVPGTLAAVAVAREASTPLIVMAAISLPAEDLRWTYSVVQPTSLMVSAIVDRMKRTGVRNIGYIGFSDSWGDQAYAELLKAAKVAGLAVVSNERYARADASVTGQVLKVMAARPDAVVTGTSGSAGALPYLALAERGYRGAIYGMHSLVNPEFVRVGGAAVEGLLVPTGPVVVAEQLASDSSTRKVAMEFREAYKRVNSGAATDAFSGYGFDAWLVGIDAASRVARTTEPGTAQFRTALRDAISTTQELVGAHGVYNFKPGQLYGLDERGRVLAKLEKGAWKLQP